MICQNEIQKGLSLQQQPLSGAHLAMGDCRGIVEHCINYGTNLYTGRNGVSTHCEASKVALPHLC